MKTITTKRLPATNTLGARIKAECSEARASIIIPESSDSCPPRLDHINACKTLMLNLGWTGEMVSGSHKDCYVWVFADTSMRASVSPFDVDLERERNAAESMPTSRTLKALNKYLQERVPELELVNGQGYFYFANTEHAEHATYLPESIYVYRLSHMALPDWKSNLDRAILRFKTEANDLNNINSKYTA